jgi:hypothetical protein
MQTHQLYPWRLRSFARDSISLLCRRGRETFQREFALADQRGTLGERTVACFDEVPSSNACSDLLRDVSSPAMADKRRACRNVPRSRRQFGGIPKLDPYPAQDYIAADMMNDTQIIVRRRRAKMARASVFV